MIERRISDERYHMEALDGFRGFAALIVVFSHTSNSGFYFAPFLDLEGIGKSGVFLFFLLSSFLLTLPLLETGRRVLSVPVLSLYWQRRLFRIYPLYTLYLLLGVFTTWALSACCGKHGVGIPFDLDWPGFFKHMTLREGKGVTWSIAVEFKFYFVLPLVVFCTALVRPFGFPATTLYFLTLLVLSQVISPQSESAVNDARLLPYMPIFIVGMYCAVIQNALLRNQALLERWTRVIRVLGYVGVIGIVIMTPSVFSLIAGTVPRNYFHEQYILYSCLWAFVLLSAVNGRGWIRRFFSLPQLRFLGALSFSLYLFHPIFIEAARHARLNTYLSAWLVLMAATVSAYVSFRLLEGPMSRFRLTRDAFAPLFAWRRRGKQAHRAEQTR